jgi:hypothetical protein
LKSEQWNESPGLLTGMLQNQHTHIQGRSQTVTEVTVVTGPGAQGGPEGTQEGSPWGPKDPRKGSGKELA